MVYNHGAMREHLILPPEPYPSYAAYLADAGGSGVEQAKRAGAEAVLEELRRSGLRGRGGAGFPAGAKWASIRGHRCPTRFVVCNAAEGEPGTFKDRMLLRRNPYATLEGMIIAARVVGAREGFIALKASFEREIARVRSAVDELAGAGLLDGFGITIVEGPEEYLFGEEKALLNVIDGVGPLPRTPDQPPYEVGLRATATSPNPALVGNAETFARVPGIVRHGAGSFRALGTADTPGPLLFTLSGDLRSPGVYEMEAGIPLRRLFHEAGGGPRDGRTLRAALSGVSSGVIVAEQFDTPAEFGALSLLGAGLGAAGFVVFDDEASLPRVAQAAARFLYVESCNQCSACKVGLRIASNALDGLFADGATTDLIERALVGAQHAPQGNRCYLPVEGAVLIPSFVRRFRDDFERQARRGADAPPPYTLPKIVDWDEAARRFVYDEHQAWKQPDWTYQAPPAQPPGRAATATPAPRPSGPITVPIAPDLAARIGALAEANGLDLDHQLDAILRRWLDAEAAAGREE